MALSLAMTGLELVLAAIGRAEPPLTRAAARGWRGRRAVRRVCVRCERQRARFREHGMVTWGRYQALCRRCLSAEAARRAGPKR